jgi:hypothetical protein
MLARRERAAGKLAFQSVCRVLAWGVKPEVLKSAAANQERSGGTQRDAGRNASANCGRGDQSGGSSSRVRSWGQTCTPAPQRCAAGWQQSWLQRRRPVGGRYGGSQGGKAASMQQRRLQKHLSWASANDGCCCARLPEAVASCGTQLTLWVALAGGGRVLAAGATHAHGRCGPDSKQGWQE